MKLAYQACDSNGKVVSGMIDAGDSTEAIERLRGEGKFVTSISAVTEGNAKQAGAAKVRTGRARNVKKNVMMFTRQFHLLLSTGTPIFQALESLERQMNDPAWATVLRDIRKHVEDGNALSDAMRRHPKFFDPIYCSLIGAGELSGKLSPMLERLATLTRKQMQVRNAIMGAMIYPCLLLAISAAVIILMLTLVLPRFEQLFSSMDVPLPPSTKAIMLASHLIRDNWIILLPTVGLAVAGLVFWLRSGPGSRVVDTAVIRLPQLGKIVRNFITAKIARLLGILLDSHLPLTDVLDLVRHSIRNHHYVRLIVKAEEAVTQGEPVSSAFTNTDLIGSTIHEAMRSGEQTGQMASSLITIADFMDEENDVVVRSLTSIIEPMILIVLGAIVGFMALSMFLPLFDMTSMGG